VANKSNSAQNGVKFKKSISATMVLEVVASFLLITYALPKTVGLGGGGPCEVEPRILLHPYLQPSVFEDRQ